MYYSKSEITIVLNAEHLQNREYLRILSSKLLALQNAISFEIINIGIPISSNTNVVEECMNHAQLNLKVFSYIDLNSKKSLLKWLEKYPHLKTSSCICFKASPKTDWNAFLGSVWDLAKEGLEIRLLDSNQIFTQSNALKKINSLILRGVFLGFYPSFPRKWFQSRDRVIQNIAKLRLVDFWIISVEDLESNNFNQFADNVYKYNAALEQK